MCSPWRRCQPERGSNPCQLPYYVLEDLEREIKDTKREIANLRIAGFHAKAERKSRSLRFFWELWSELRGKIENIEKGENADEGTPEMNVKRIFIICEGVGSEC